MKSLLILAFYSFFCLIDNQVPTAIQERFEEMFPNVKDVHWELRKEGHIATFKHYHSQKKAVFSPDGNWVETRITRAIWQCPDSVIAYVEQNHPEAAITAAAKVVSVDDVLYRVEAEYTEKVVIILLNEGGYPLQEKEIPFTVELDF